MRVPFSRRRSALVTALLAGSLALSAAPALAQPDPGGGGVEDLEGPSITVTAPAGAYQGWYNGPRTITVKATDGSGVAGFDYVMSGATSASGSLRAAGDSLTISNAGSTTITLDAVDAFDNPSQEIWVVGVDDSFPAVSIQSPSNGQVVFKGQPLALRYGCTDAWTGVKDCVGPQPTESLLDTGTLGTRTVTVEARDYVGNYTPRTVSYTVVDNVFTITKAPVLTGVAKVGETLTVNDGEIAPAPDIRTFQWRRGTADIPDAKGRTYVVSPDDVGSELSVVTSIRRDGITPRTSVSNLTQPVTWHTFGLQKSVSVSGTAKVGSTLTLTRAVYDRVPQTRVVEWLRDGEAITGATGTTYTLTPEDLGAVIEVTETATSPNHAPSKLIATVPGTIAPGTFELRTAPTVVGAPEVGRTLKVTGGVFAPAPTTTTYRWLRNGVAVAGATGTSYTLTKADVGRRISVEVSAARAAYSTAARVSAATALVPAPAGATAKAVSKLKVKTKALGKRKARVTVTVAVAGIKNPGGTVIVKHGKKVLRADVKVKNGKAVIKLKKLKKGKVRLTVIYSGTSKVKASKVTTKSFKVRA